MLLPWWWMQQKFWYCRWKLTHLIVWYYISFSKQLLKSSKWKCGQRITLPSKPFYQCQKKKYTNNLILSQVVRTVNRPSKHFLRQPFCLWSWSQFVDRMPLPFLNFVNSVNLVNIVIIVNIVKVFVEDFYQDIRQNFCQNCSQSS